MVSTGMIFQFNSEQGTGLVMLSNGETKEFSLSEWIDASTEPAIGLKVSYENSDNLVKIKVLGEEENIINEKKKEKNEVSFGSLQECQTYFSNKGFEVIKSTEDTLETELTMGKFSDSSVECISISLKNSKVELIETTMELTSVDEYINYFKDIGYKLAKDVDNGKVRSASLRRFLENGHAEMIITSSDSNITVKTMVNGKEVR